VVRTPERESFEGGYETRPYVIESWLPGAVHIDVVAGFIPASLHVHASMMLARPVGGYETRPYDIET
jgi:hypothetical protein